MKINGRAALKVGGTGAVLAAAGGVWRAWEQGVWSAGEGPAYEPWRRWRSDPSEGPLALVRAAILAANPHNSQPWLFRVGASRIDLFADPARDIGAVDPDHREMYIGLGCALRSEEHTSELQSPCNLVCRLLLEKKNRNSPAGGVQFLRTKHE